MGNAIFINGMIKVFKMCSGVQRNISFLEIQPGSKGITEKKFLIQADGIKGRVAKERVRPEPRMCSEKVQESKNQKPCFVNGFVFIRRIGFFSMVISGCFSKKILL